MKELENPIWTALASAQSHLARPAGAALRFPADIAPFAAVAEADVALDDAALALIGADTYFLGALPQVASGWRLKELGAVLQMVYQGGALAAPPTGAICELAPDDPAMQELTALAFPGYFRPRTGELGRYIGLREAGRLIALSGERMDLGRWREISAVCTHPEHTGRGYARLLVSHIMQGMLEQGVTPMLHVGAANTRARALYESMGFAPTRELRHAQLTK
ncbi:GNAT family N-acetyltransferase [Massilia sp. erpn]|uniref:GNAT family N-acetyltransferase n=1 Tax=Massilia sp. erpn TaxID=2738142 RepID=UPI002103993E|nr:GNAT family N-acetyltransferase [Massilia sp. erpn]UTY60300.1 GNAT family N-acetyltransferase [Massilia sp. erpn]